VPRLSISIGVGTYNFGCDELAVVVLYCSSAGSGERGGFVVYSVAGWHRALMDDESALGSRERWKKKSDRSL
jgi:hypothetical protein